jgi:hypothetical protein
MTFVLVHVSVYAHVSYTTQDTFMIIKKNGKFFPLHAMKAYKGSRGIAPLIINLGTRWR